MIKFILILVFNTNTHTNYLLKILIYVYISKIHTYNMHVPITKVVYRLRHMTRNKKLKYINRISNIHQEIQTKPSHKHRLILYRYKMTYIHITKYIHNCK